MYCSKYLFRSGSERERLTQEHYFKSSKEMRILFHDLPEAYDNTLEIAVDVHLDQLKGNQCFQNLQLMK